MSKSKKKSIYKTLLGQERNNRPPPHGQVANGVEDTKHEDARPQATAQPTEVVMPPVPPGESSFEAVQKTQAVSDALTQFGENAESKQVTEAVKARTGIDLNLREVTQIMDALRKGVKKPTG